jgi:hypothetical protein
MHYPWSTLKAHYASEMLKNLFLKNVSFLVSCQNIQSNTTLPYAKTCFSYFALLANGVFSELEF